MEAAGGEEACGQAPKAPLHTEEEGGVKQDGLLMFPAYDRHI